MRGGIKMEKSEKNGLVTLLLSLFLPFLAYFYVGKNGKGVLLLLLSLVGVGYVFGVINVIRILLGKFTDNEGKVVALS